MLNDDNDIGYYIREGYRWKQNSAWILVENRFNIICGSSHIIYSDENNLPECKNIRGRETDFDITHQKVVCEFEKKGKPLKKVPFRGVIKVEHGENISSQYPLAEWDTGLSPNWKYHVGKFIKEIKRLPFMRSAHLTLKKFI